MRTTLTLDDEIARSLKERARLLDKPFRRVVNDVLRRGLAPAMAEERAPYRIAPNHSSLQPGRDPLRLNQLNDQLEAEEFADRSPE